MSGNAHIEKIVARAHASGIYVWNRPTWHSS